MDELASATREGGAYLVIGIIERDGGTLYCTALFFGPDGLLGKHRKLMPTAVERIIWGFGDGSTLPVFDTPGGKMGAVICWENYMPLLRAAIYARGIQIYCAPTADDRETWVPTMRHIALESRCFELSACQYIRRGDYPAIQGDDPQTVLMRGGSVIVNPLGRVLAEPDYSDEKILTADLDPGEIAEGKFDLDVTGHYSRPDVFRLEVNEKAGFQIIVTLPFSGHRDTRCVARHCSIEPPGYPPQPTAPSQAHNHDRRSRVHMSILFHQ